MKKVTLVSPVRTGYASSYVKPKAVSKDKLDDLTNHITSQKRGGGKHHNPPIIYNNNRVGLVVLPSPIPVSDEKEEKEKTLVSKKLSKEPSQDTSLEDLLSLADQLNKEDHKKLLAHLALKTQGLGKDEGSRDKTMWSQAVYEALLKANGTGDGAGQGPALVKRLLAPTSVWAPLEDFMESSRLSKLTVTERLSMYRLLANLLVSHCQQVARHMRIPLGAKLVAGQAVNVAAIFDNAFPGYLAAGLVPVVAKHLMSPH